MTHLVWVILLFTVLVFGMVHHQVWWWRRRAANHAMRAQAERDFASRAAAQLDENERRYGVAGHLRAPTAEEIAEVRRRYGLTGRMRVRALTDDDIAEARKRYEWND